MDVDDDGDRIWLAELGDRALVEQQPIGEQVFDADAEGAIAIDLK